VESLQLSFATAAWTVLGIAVSERLVSAPNTTAGVPKTRASAMLGSGTTRPDQTTSDSPEASGAEEGSDQLPCRRPLAKHERRDGDRRQYLCLQQQRRKAGWHSQGKADVEQSELADEQREEGVSGRPGPTLAPRKCYAELREVTAHRAM